MNKFKEIITSKKGNIIYDRMTYREGISDMHHTLVENDI
jgi:hypothetical protein